ncbi:MAG: AmmeMemoRadiSam system protein B [Nitrospina sp.]|jgi:MEMO1 family protein|nr:AmmeMemoRadiSam system protein B [Nitrospina sp.]MBT5632519.1 AmmeMemoRadiSam system protein B [Nitrospina sp.]
MKIFGSDNGDLKKRQPAVAGRFYSEEQENLVREVESHIERNVVRSPVLGIVAPHAGFKYSGDVAGAVYSRIEIPDTVILIGPNHTGRGEAVAVMTEGVWSMPMGDVAIDYELANAICEETVIAKPDSSAHRFEHSLETQLPFLQYFKKDFKIVPICLMRLQASACKVLSEGIVRAVNRLGRSVLLVASSDMTHYESQGKAETLDRKAIACIKKRDPVELYETVRSENITMCGVNPVTVMLHCCESLGAKESELVKYMTSGDVSGDMDKVVGYAGLVIK